jgi:hypothetical protein
MSRPEELPAGRGLIIPVKYQMSHGYAYEYIKVHRAFSHYPAGNRSNGSSEAIDLR